MIDTIHLRVTSLSVHSELIRYLEFNFQKQTTRFPDKLNILNKKLNYGAQVYHDTGRQLIGMKRTGKLLNSRNSSFTYVLDELRDMITFNFSVPKMLYGQNIFEFINTDSRKFSYSTLSSFDHQIELLYSKFLHFMDYIFKTVLNDLVHLQYASLNRIDFCYNYYCNGTDDKELFLRKIKDTKLARFASQKSYLTSSAQEGTIMFHSKPQSFKIYSKYEEFISNDFKKLEPGKLRSDLLEKSKNILRFEWTLRAQALSKKYVKYRGDILKEKGLYFYYKKFLYLKSIQPDLDKMEFIKLITEDRDYAIAWHNRKGYGEILKTKPIYFYKMEGEYSINNQYFNILLKDFKQILINFFDIPQYNTVKLTKRMLGQVEKFDALFKNKNFSYEQIATYYDRRTFKKLKVLHQQIYFADSSVYRELSYEKYFNNFKQYL